MNRDKMDSSSERDWLFEITPSPKLVNINLREIWQYRDLLVLFIRRNIVAVYKQTVLGPLWFFIQPLFTSFIQFIIFGKIADLPSDGVPYFLFVLAGNTLWGFFSSTLLSSSETFRSNAAIFGKVYFPRAIMPIAMTVSGLVKFFIQVGLFVMVLLYLMYTGVPVKPNILLLTFPLVIVVMSMTAMGFGMVITSMSTKYRDFSILMGFATSLFMYLTPIVYPTSLAIEKSIENGLPSWLIYANPLTGIFDLFKYSFMGEGLVNWYAILYSVIFSLIVYFLGLIVFNITEKNFMDTV